MLLFVSTPVRYVLTHLRIVANGQRKEEEAAKVRKDHNTFDLPGLSWG